MNLDYLEQTDEQYFGAISLAKIKHDQKNIQSKFNHHYQNLWNVCKSSFLRVPHQLNKINIDISFLTIGCLIIGWLQLRCYFAQLYFVSELLWVSNFVWILFLINLQAFAKSDYCLGILGFIWVHSYRSQAIYQQSVSGVLLQSIGIGIFFLYGNKYFNTQLGLILPTLCLIIFSAFSFSTAIFLCACIMVRKLMEEKSKKISKQFVNNQNVFTALSVIYSIIYRMKDPFYHIYIAVSLLWASLLFTQYTTHIKILRNSSKYLLIVYNILIMSLFGLSIFGINLQSSLKSISSILKTLWIAYFVQVISLGVNSSNTKDYLTKIIHKKCQISIIKSDRLFKGILLHYSLTLSLLVMLTQSAINITGTVSTSKFELIMLIINILYYKTKKQKQIDAFLLKFLIILMPLSAYENLFVEYKDLNMHIEFKTINRCDLQNSKIFFSLSMGISAVLIKLINPFKYQQKIYKIALFFLFASLISAFVNLKCIVNYSFWVYLLILFFIH